MSLRRSAFTLVDLLVISTLAVIVVGLMPTLLMRLRQVEVKQHDIDAKRHMGIAVYNYYEQRDQFPPASQPPSLADHAEEFKAFAQKVAPPASISYTLASPRDSHGAIAYSFKTGRYGYSFNCDSKDEAKKKAIKNCNADDAEVLATVTNGCAALAVGDDNAYGVGFMDTRTDAEDRALKECGRRAKNCKLITWTCCD